LEKLERMERMGESHLEATHLLNSMKLAEMMSTDIVFFGQSFDTFKNRISKFSDIFTHQ
jgi:polysaccharide pyruvyl transferase WcaK-like protein